MEWTDKTGMTLPDWYAARLQDALTVNERQVFFVLGCQKSGTTWVQRLLDAHPEVVCGGEGHILDVMLPLMKQFLDVYNEKQALRQQSNLDVRLDDQSIVMCVKLLSDHLLAQYLRESEKADAARAVGDKTPEYALAPDMLHSLYSQAKFIHVIRDGRDACVSGWAHLQRTGKADQFTGLGEYASFFAEKHWVSYITQMREYAREQPDSCLEIRYEDLQVEPDDAIRKMLDFLGVDAGEGSQGLCRQGGAFETLTGGRARGDEDGASFFRKGVVGDWREHFDESMLAQFEGIAGPMLEESGYAVASADLNAPAV